MGKNMTYKVNVDGVDRDATPEETAIIEADIVAFAAEQTERAKTQYQRDRAAEYPPMADYLDGIVKNDQAQINKYIADCLAVKNKYPKV
jgi:hypothetical protein